MENNEEIELEAEFFWIWGSIAESKAKLELYDEAIEAAIKCRDLCIAHVYPQYGMFKWELLKWFLEAGRIIEAKKHFSDILEPYLWSENREDSTYSESSFQ